MKKIKQLCFVVLIFIFSVPTFATEEIDLPDFSAYPSRILMNGQYIEAPVMPKESNNHIILYPLRAIFESAGFMVNWSGETADVRIPLSNGKELKLNLEQKKVYLNNSPVGFVELEVIDGTTVVAPEFFRFSETIQAQWDPLSKTALISVIPPRTRVVVYYDLEKKTSQTALDKTLTYELNGGIAVPETFYNPVVFIIHGSHPVQKSAENRYDLGFSYLLKTLAEQGYTAITINANMQYSFEDGEPMGTERIERIFQNNLQALKLANDGVNNEFGINLKNKMDFSKVLLVGHSRGAGATYRIAAMLKDIDPDVNVMGILSIAPADIDPNDAVLTDIPSSIIVPELDGDVISLEGFKTFDFFYDLRNRKSDAQLIYLYGANHNAFNEALLKQDQGKIWFKGTKVPISVQAQREFMGKYMMAFANAVTSSNPLSTIANSSEGILFGETVMVDNLYVGTEKVYVPKDVLPTATNATVEKVLQSNISDENTVGLFNHPGVDGKMDFLKIKWVQKNASVHFKTDAKIMDMSEKKMLHLYLAPDSTSELNHQENQSFTVTLVDEQGEKSTVLLDRNTKALMYQEGESIFDQTLYSSYTPLGTIDIPLEQFQGIDLSKVQEIQFVFSENESGVLIVRSISI